MAGASRAGLGVEQLQQFLSSVDASLHDPLREYMAPAVVFDAAAVACVYDLRLSGVTWALLEEKLEARFPKQRQGFPRVGDSETRERLLEFCRVSAVLRTPETKVE